MKRRQVFHLISGLCLGLLAAPPLLLAHGSLQPQIGALGELLKAEPGNPEILLQRADLERLEGHYGAAREDLARVEKIAPGRADTAWVRARVWLDQHQPEAALPDLDRWLQAHPHHRDALTLRAQAHQAMGEAEGALRDYAKALAVSPTPDPELYVELARLRAAEDPQAALALIDQGIERLGALPALQTIGIEIATDAGDLNAALARLEPVLASARRKETWFARQAELLERQGRPDEASQSWAAVLSACQALPPHLRSTPAMKALAAMAAGRLGAFLSLNAR